MPYWIPTLTRWLLQGGKPPINSERFWKTKKTKINENKRMKTKINENKRKNEKRKGSEPAGGRFWAGGQMASNCKNELKRK